MNPNTPVSICAPPPTEKPIDRIIEKLSYEMLPLIPQFITPNQLTWAGAIAGIFSAVSFYLSQFSKTWFLVAAIGVILHMMFDSLDGVVARSRSLSSKSGCFLDIFTDNLVFIVISVAVFLSPYSLTNIVLFIGIIYPLNSVVVLEWEILTEKRFFPPIFSVWHVHLAFVFIALLSFFWSSQIVFSSGTYTFDWFDIVIGLSVVPSILDLLFSARKLINTLDQRSS